LRKYKSKIKSMNVSKSTHLRLVVDEAWSPAEWITLGSG
jgi:hypothetical protein